MDLRFTLFPEFMKSWAAAQAKRGRYFGEVEYRLEYKAQPSEAYSWLFVDQKTLEEYALESGWFSRIIFEEEGQYLARLIRSSKFKVQSSKFKVLSPGVKVQI